MKSLLWLSGLAFLTALALVPVCRRVARRYGCEARPSRERWHRRPTPLLGGVAIGVTVIGLLGVTGRAGDLGVLLAGAGLMCALGLADDVRALRPATRLVVEIAIASLLVFFGYRLHWVESLTGDTLLTLIWIVGITNAFNLLDNMDGLCAGVALIAGLSLLAAYGGAEPLAPEVAYVALLAGACAAFLVYNAHPASIFLGDSGALFLGVSLAAATLGFGERAGGESSVLAVIAVPAFVLLIPILDTTFVTLARVLSGRTPATGGRDHTSHRLVAIGLSERRAVATLWALAAVGGGIGVFVQRAGPGWSLVLGALFLLAMALFAVYLAQVRVYENAGQVPYGGTIIPVVVDFVHRGRLAEVSLDACLVAIAYYAAYRLRFEGGDWSGQFPLFLQSLPVVVGVQMIALFATGAYRGLWRHFGLMDGIVFVRGVAAGVVAVVITLVFAYRFAGYSRTVFAIYALLLLALLLASRSSFRLMGEFVRRRETGRRLVVYGAGDAGVVTLREVAAAAGAGWRVIGFVVDDAAQHGRRVHGYEILGGYDALAPLVRAREVDLVILSDFRVDARRLSELERLCSENRVALSRMRVEMEHLVTD